MLERNCGTDESHKGHRLEFERVSKSKMLVSKGNFARYESLLYLYMVSNKLHRIYHTISIRMKYTILATYKRKTQNTLIKMKFKHIVSPKIENDKCF